MGFNIEQLIAQEMTFKNDYEKQEYRNKLLDIIETFNYFGNLNDENQIKKCEDAKFKLNILKYNIE